MRPLLLSLFGCLTLISAAKHHLFIGTFSGPYLYALEFDDATLALTLTGNISASSAHSWISLSHNSKALYGSAIVSDSYYSYTVNNGSSLIPSGAVTMAGNCSAPLPSAPPPPSSGTGTPPSSGEINVGQRSGLFIMATSKPPYAVYGTAPSCGNVVSTDPATGALRAVVQNITYSSTTYGISATGMHGMAISPDGRFLYAADARANSIWTYGVHNQTGGLDLVDVIEGPIKGSNPRHVATTPKGGYLYVVLEAANALAQYKVDSRTGKPALEGVMYPLIKPGLNSSLYWSDEVMLSSSAKYLWATTRARSAGTPGYISAFTLSSTGAIEKQLFLTETTTSGGAANAVTPAPFSDQFVALTDAEPEKGFVQIWRLKNEESSPEVVAEVALRGGRCCANAVWYD